MKKFLKKINIFSQSGTTIVELMIYMTILSILLIVLTNVFTAALDVQSESNASSSVEEDGNYILARMDYDIHRAQSINVPTADGATADYFQIIIGGVNYAYGTDANSNLILTTNLIANNLNNYGTSVTAFSVRRLGNVGGVEDTLKISFTVTSRTKRISGYETKDFSTNLSLRRQ